MTDEFSRPADLVQLLRRNAVERPDGVAVRRAGSDGLTWAAVDERARALAGLLARRVVPGDRVALLFGSDEDFLPALFGCWYAGAVALPLPPGRPGVRAIEQARPTAVVTTEELSKYVGDDYLSVDRALSAGLSLAADRATHDVAVLQYTSGSTGLPRGVVITHSNYMQNLRMIDEFMRSIGLHGGPVQVVDVLPLYHDMGLAQMMFATWRAGTTTLVSPLTFLKSPAAWLRAISEAGGEMTAAPNFFYDLCVRRVSAEDVSELDLSSMTVVLNGAEPVREDTLERFVERFGPAGFRLEAFAPCFGMAEGTVFVSGVRHGGPPRVVRFGRAELQRGRAVEKQRTGRALVSCGRRAEGLAVRIVDPTTSAECDSGEIGEIWVNGPSIGRGYWEDPDSASIFDAHMAGFDRQGYLRTGDLGFLWEGELFVTGRVADVMELDGRMVHPEDIEYTIERSSPALHGRRLVVFPESADSPRLTVVAEVRLAFPVSDDQRTALERAARAAAEAEHGVELGSIALVKTGTIPVTTSGKARRTRAREMFAVQHS